MEIVREMGDGPDKGKLKDCCGTLLHLQFELMEEIRAAYPELHQDND